MPPKKNYMNQMSVKTMGEKHIFGGAKGSGVCKGQGSDGVSFPQQILRFDR